MNGLHRWGWLSGSCVSVLFLVAACDRSAREPLSSSPSQLASAASQSEPNQPRQQSGAAPAPSTVPAGPRDSALPKEKVPSFSKSSFPAAERVVAIGDLHGDYSATERVFRLAGVIDDAGHWSGENMVLVQTGDQLDRGDDEAKILRFLERLQREAEQAGGRVVVLNGNHETMNVLGDFRYVTPGALDDFDEAPPSPWAKMVTGPAAERARSLLPGGGTALRLAERPLVAKVGDTVFAHGGVLPAHVRYGIDRLNDEASAWMRGERRTPPPPVSDPDGPLWTRLYGEPELDAQACATLEEALRLLGAERMVVGHTVQRRGLSSACGGKVFRIDVGLSAHYGEHPVQALEIRADRTLVLSEAQRPDD